MALFKYGTKLAFKKMGLIFLPPFHLSSPPFFVQNHIQPNNYLEFSNGRVFWKNIRETKILLRKDVCCFIGGTIQLPGKAPYLKQLMGGCHYLVLLLSPSGMQRAIPQGNTATLGASAVNAQGGGSAEKIISDAGELLVVLG